MKRLLNVVKHCVVGSGLFTVTVLYGLRPRDDHIAFALFAKRETRKHILSACTVEIEFSLNFGQ